MFIVLQPEKPRRTLYSRKKAYRPNRDLIIKLTIASSGVRFTNPFQWGRALVFWMSAYIKDAENLSRLPVKAELKLSSETAHHERSLFYPHTLLVWPERAFASMS